jgi:excisionase family DNA binding protein
MIKLDNRTLQEWINRKDMATWYSTTFIAKWLKVDARKVRRWIYDGKLKAYQAGGLKSGQWKIKNTDFIAFLRKGSHLT